MSFLTITPLKHLQTITQGCERNALPALQTTHQMINAKGELLFEVGLFEWPNVT